MGFFGNVRESFFGESGAQEAARLRSEANTVMESAYAHVREGMSAITQLSLALEDRGWIQVDGLDRKKDSNHLTFAAVQAAAKHGTALVQGNPIMNAAVEAQIGYVHGDGVRIDGADQIIKKNRHTVFGTEAIDRLEKTKAGTGNVMLLVEDDNTITQIPFYEIKGAVYDPNDSSRINYFLREWEEEITDFETGVPQAIPHKRLYRNMHYSLPREFDLEEYTIPDLEDENGLPFVGVRARRINGVEVDLDGVIRHVAPHRMVGGAWGLPDILAGIFYAGEHKDLLEAGHAVWSAQSQYAVNYRSKTKKALEEVAARVATPQFDPGTGKEIKYGQTTGMGSDVEMQLTQKIGAGIDFRSFDPIAGLASVALGVPLEVVLGQESHDSNIPFTTKRRMNGIRALWTEVFEDIFEHMGKRKVRIHWPKMDPDPTHRQVQSIVGLAKTKMASPEEVRGLFIRTFDVDWPDEVPDPSEWDRFTSTMQTPAPGATETPGDGPITPGQGQTGQLGPLADGDHELRDEGLQDHYTPKG